MSKATRTRACESRMRRHTGWRTTASNPYITTLPRINNNLIVYFSFWIFSLFILINFLLNAAVLILGFHFISFIICATSNFWNNQHNLKHIWTMHNKWQQFSDELLLINYVKHQPMPVLCISRVVCSQFLLLPQRHPHRRLLLPVILAIGREWNGREGWKTRRTLRWNRYGEE